MPELLTGQDLLFHFKGRIKGKCKGKEVDSVVYGKGGKATGKGKGTEDAVVGKVTGKGKGEDTDGGKAGGSTADGKGGAGACTTSP